MRDTPIDAAKAPVLTEREIVLQGMGFRKLNLRGRVAVTQWRNDQYGIQINEDIDYASLYRIITSKAERHAVSEAKRNLRNALMEAMGLEEHSEYNADSEYGSSERTYLRIDERA